MGWVRNWSWRIAILLLPWQVRWFSARGGPAFGGQDILVGDLPWEQGRLSVYLSWLPIILTIFFACEHVKKNLDDKPFSSADWSVAIGMLLLGLPAFVSIYPQASWQWLTQIALLAFFAWSLLLLRIGRQELLAWSVAAIVPHALLAVWQYGSQEVIGTKWLGIASQHPTDLGVSVVEVGGRRVLRAYGGFPHPNILGGWLAYGMVVATLVMTRVTPHASRYIGAGTVALFAIALVFTFSRSAWIAATIGVVAVTIMAWKKAWTLEEKMRLFLMPIVIVIATVGSLVLVRDVALVRTQSDARLEMKSVDERTSSLAAAWNLVGKQWWLGQGQNTAILALDRAGFGIVPPHFVFLLMLLETGVVGSLGAALLLVRWIGRSGSFGFLVLVVGAPLVFFDHYAWSLWAGQSLVMLFALLPFVKEEARADARPEF